MIGLIDFLKTSGVAVNPDSLKLHLACWSGKDNPLDVYYAGKFKAWQEDQSRRNFKCDQVIGLIALGNGDWLFAGVYKVRWSRRHPRDSNRLLYVTHLLPNQDDLVGRIVVHHKRSSRASYVWYTPDYALSIAEVRREKLAIEDFPGYNSVILSHDMLRLIIRQKIRSWYGALSNNRGVYLITDTSTGKQYVGKASGDEAIWQRWCGYADNGHGKNKQLEKLLKENGADHARYFQYSILEIADTHASNKDILARESYWMSVLKTREFGLN